MAVDQARHLMLNTTNNIYLTNNLTTNSYDIVGVSVLPTNDSLLVNNTGGAKLSPPVKDDSGVTFNNSCTVSRKRPRDSTVLVNTSSVNSVVRKESCGLSFLGEDLSLQIMQQQLQIDRLISQHMEKMRMEIEERKKQQLRRTMALIEEAMRRKLREKELEINKINKINFALEEKVKSIYIENQIWRDLAQTNEATANTLRSNLEQLLQQVKQMVEQPNVEELTDDAVSCCGSSGYGGENEYDEKNDVVKGGWIYRGDNGKRMCIKCGEGESRVLLLPCRHLCLCTLCGPMVNSCPICNSAKNASVHVNFS